MFVKRFIMERGLFACGATFGSNCCYSSIESPSNQVLLNNDFNGFNGLEARKKQMLSNAFQRRTNIVKMLKMREQNADVNSSEENVVKLNEIESENVKTNENNEQIQLLSS